MIHVLRIDVRDDGNRRRQLDDRAVGLIGLDNHPVALPQPRIRAIGIDDAAIDHRRIEPACFEQRGHHRRSRRLAMCTGDGHGALQAHQLGQHLGALDRRRVARAGSSKFRIVCLHGR